MWNPKRIKFTNLFSHKNSEYEFLNNKCVIISGENRSDRSLDNNGAGKTTLFEAITIALTNESLRNIKKEDFINKEEDECVIDFELINATLKKTLRIVRKFHRNKSVKVEIWEDDKINNQIVSVNEANKRVLELIGISREDLLRYYIISQDNAYTFFTASDTEKKEIMNRITQASMIQPAIAKLDEQKTLLMAKLGGLEAKVSNYEAKNQTLLEQKNYLIENNDRQHSIDNMIAKINDCEDKKEQLKKQISAKHKEIEQLSKQIDAIEVEDTKQLLSQKKEYEEKIDEFERILLEDKNIRRNLKSELDATIECPKCGWEFINGSDLDITVEEAKNLLAQTEKHVENITIKKEKIERKYNAVKQHLLIVKKNKNEREELEDKKRRLRRDFLYLQEQVEQKENMITTLKSEMQKLKEDDTTSKHIKKIEQDIKDNQKLITDLKREMEPLEQELEMVRFWLFNLGKNGFTTYLANKSVKTIEGVTNSYLRKFGVELSVLINGYKILKSGEVREKIEVFVSGDGITAEAFMSKSGGERSRVTLAGILGIQQLINNSLGGRGLDFLALDEAISGVDSRGTIEIIKTLNNCGRTVMMITQNIEDSTICDNVLQVIKDKGVSYYNKVI